MHRPGLPWGMAAGKDISEELLLSHSSFVRALARGLLRDESEVDDVVQETMLRAIESGPSGSEYLHGCLAVVARNLIYKRLRSRARVRRREEEAARPERRSSTADLVERETSLQRVTAAVLDLPEHYRQVLLLRYFEDLPPPARTAASRSRAWSPAGRPCASAPTASPGDGSRSIPPVPTACRSCARWSTA